MKDAYAVLLQKEADIKRLRHEIEALRLIIPLLSDEIADSPPLRDKNRWPLEIKKSERIGGPNGI